jgi:CRP/FNR family transcriptional regulator
MKDIIKTAFPGFEPDLVAELLQQGEFKTFKAGDVLMRTGQFFRSSILILRGRIKVYREDLEGSEYFMYYLQPGQACALSMICAAKRETSQITAIAETDLEVLTIPLERMDDWMLQYKTWYYFVLETFRSRFEEMLQTLDHVVFRNMDDRLLFYLKRQQDTLQTNILTVSPTEIAQELNSSREVISRLLKKLAEKGMIRLGKNQQVEITHLNL